MKAIVLFIVIILLVIGFWIVNSQLKKRDQQLDPEKNHQSNHN